VHISAHIDSSNIRIGEQVRLHLVATYNGQKGLVKIQWPTIGDTLISKIRVVSKSKIDTLLPDSNHPTMLQQRQDILITSFDSGYYAIPPFNFVINGDTSNVQQTEPVLLQVHTIAVDTTKGIRDIKGPVTAPFSWIELLPWIGIIFGALLVLSLIAYFLSTFFNTKPKPVVIKAPPVDPHVKALQALEELAAKKLWQEGKIKEYHSTISDVLRMYISERFGIDAPEMITSDIVYAMRIADVDETLKNKLRQTLVLADLVKFAKEQPIAAENEMSLANAFDFVKGSIPVKKEPEPAQHGVTVNQPPQS
jgi:hypothetical protein